MIKSDIYYGVWLSYDPDGWPLTWCRGKYIPPIYKDKFVINQKSAITTDINAAYSYQWAQQQKFSMCQYEVREYEITYDI